jgi:hypothetical protein
LFCCRAEKIMEIAYSSRMKFIHYLQEHRITMTFLGEPKENK